VNFAQKLTLTTTRKFDRVYMYRGEGAYHEEAVKGAVEGISAVDEKTQREGIVITATTPGRWARGIGRVQLKWKSSAFLEKEGNR